MVVLLLLAGLFGMLSERSVAPPIVTVIAHDYAFTAPDTIPSGATTFRFNDRGKFDHHLIVFRLGPGITLSDFLRAMGSGGKSPAGIASLGGLQSDKGYRRAPGGDSPSARRAHELTLVLRAGNYVLACLHAEEGVTHLQKGMMRSLTVIPARRAVARPKFDATITMSDYAYAVSGNLTSGRRTIRLANAGPQEHHVFVQQMRPGKSLADIKAHRAARAKQREANRPDSMSTLIPPMIPVTGITRMSPGEEAFVTLDLVVGHYRLFCLVPDAGDGKPHTHHGMDQLILVGPAKR